MQVRAGGHLDRRPVASSAIGGVQSSRRVAGAGLGRWGGFGDGQQGQADDGHDAEGGRAGNEGPGQGVTSGRTVEPGQEEQQDYGGGR